MPFVLRPRETLIGSNYKNYSAVQKAGLIFLDQEYFVYEFDITMDTPLPTDRVLTEYFNPMVTKKAYYIAASNGRTYFWNDRDFDAVMSYFTKRDLPCITSPT
jgi:hypothetical protein